MKFRTEISIDKAPWQIEPGERMLLVGSCFADNIGRRLQQEHFNVTVNPYGVMYNPASIRHTVERVVRENEDATDEPPRVTLLTLGTNHVYVLNATGEIVDNCRKQPQSLFTERELTVDECTDHLTAIVQTLLQWRDDMHIVVTVSPIRYAKYGYHGSQLSKATLLLAADHLVDACQGMVTYFPAYELLNDELRDYRFYAPDMLHPSEQAVEYIYERFADTFFSAITHRFIMEWTPLRKALAHRPQDPDSEAYRTFMAKTGEDIATIEAKYHLT